MYALFMFPFESFVGITPRLYLSLFDASKIERKEENGTVVKWQIAGRKWGLLIINVGKSPDHGVRLFCVQASVMPKL